MTTFQFDTSGFVYMPQEVEVRPGVRSKGIASSDLSPFVQGYVEAMFAGGVESDGCAANIHFGFSDLAPDTLARVMDDCQRRQGDMEDVATVEDGRGFWKWRQIGDLQNYSPLAVYLGDDGKVYLRDA